MNKQIALITLAGALLATSSAQALSIFVAPADQIVDPSATATTVELRMDFGTTRASGGQFLIDLEGPISIAGFTPSAFFNTIVSGGSNFSDTDLLPQDAEFQITMITPTTICTGGVVCPSLVTGQQVIGTLALNITGNLDLDLGRILLSEGDGFGGRGPSFAEDLTGNLLTIDYGNGQVSPVPLPASAWLFATGFGLVGFWRRRRAS
jgi:hypothetical protein